MGLIYTVKDATAMNCEQPMSEDSAVPQRNPKGHFLKGNREGHGNPLAGPVQRAKSALLKAIPDAKVRAIGKRLYKIAMESPDERAALDAMKLILNYVIGKPKIEVELSSKSEMSIEERRILILGMLGVSPDEQPQFGANIKALPSPVPKALPEPQTMEDTIVPAQAQREKQPV